MTDSSRHDDGRVGVHTAGAGRPRAESCLPPGPGSRRPGGLRPGRLHPGGLRPAIAIALAALLTAGCAPQQPPATSSSAPASEASLSPSSSSSPATSTAIGTGPAAAAGVPKAPKGWKTYWDEKRTIRFILPEEWIVQPAKTYKGGIGVKINNAKGQQLAVLQTRITGLNRQCTWPKRPYLVMDSVNADSFPAVRSGAGSKMEPHFVFRLLQGIYKFWGSYGVVDESAGPDGVACMMTNTVHGPKDIGLYRFSDVAQFSPDGATGNKAFSIIGEAQDYLKSSEYRKVKRMILSLKFTS